MRRLIGRGRARFGAAGRRLARARGGGAVTEFAALLPVMVLAFAGMSEYAQAVDNWRKLTLLARTVADLTAQGDAHAVIDAALMDDILTASATVLRPFDGSGVRIVVSALGVDLDKNGLKPSVCSSYANGNAIKRDVGVPADLTVPEGFRTTGIRYVLAEASMEYRPMFGSSLLKWVGHADGTIPLRLDIPWPARGGKQHGANAYSEVVLPNGAACG